MATIKTLAELEAEDAAGFQNAPVSDEAFAKIMADTKAKAEREDAARTPEEIDPDAEQDDDEEEGDDE